MPAKIFIYHLVFFQLVTLLMCGNINKIFLDEDEIKYDPRLETLLSANNKLIIVGEKGIILISEDGETWRKVQAPTIANFKTISYGKNLFVVGGIDENNNAKIIISEDGQNWEQVQSLPPEMLSINSIMKIEFSHDKGKFVGTTGLYIFQSEDAKKWQIVSSYNIYNLRICGENFIGLARRSGEIVSSIDFPVILWSSDLKTFEERKRFSFSSSIVDVVCGENLVIIVGLISDGEKISNVGLSQDGGYTWWFNPITSSQYDLGSALPYLIKAKFIDKKFILLSQTNGEIFISDDGILWIREKITNDTGFVFNDFVVYNKENIIILGYNEREGKNYIFIRKGENWFKRKININ